MPYPSADERFQVIVDSIEIIRDMSIKMHEAGVAQPGEQKPISDLLVSLSNTLNILDPERASNYLNGLIADVMSKQKAQTPQPTGQYL